MQFCIQIKSLVIFGFCADSKLYWKNNKRIRFQLKYVFISAYFAVVVLSGYVLISMKHTI